MGTWSWAFWVGSVLVALIALWGMWRALFADRARGRRRCGKCWYDMAGVPGLKCPECGREAKREKHLGRTRRRWGRAVLAGVLLGVSGMLAVTPRIAERGWDAVPLWVVCGAGCVYDTQNHAIAEAVAERVISRNRSTTYSKTDRAMMARYAVVLLREKTPFTLMPASQTMWGTIDSTILGLSLLRDAGAECKRVEPDLVDLMLNAPDPGVQQVAAESLSGLEVPREETKAAFVGIIRTGGSPEIVWVALNALQRNRPSAEIMVPALIAALEREAGSNPSIIQTKPWSAVGRTFGRARAYDSGVLQALAWYGKDAASAAPAVRRAVARDGSLFMSAIGVLSTFGVGVADEVCQMLHSLKEDDLRMAMQVIGAQGTGAVANERCVRDLLVAHANDSSSVWAAWTLGRMRWKDPESLDALQEVIERSTIAQTRMNALDALMYPGNPIGSQAVEILRSAVDDRDSNMRVLALALVRDRLADPNSLRAEIAAAAADEDERVREIARQLQVRMK